MRYLALLALLWASLAPAGPPTPGMAVAQGFAKPGISFLGTVSNPTDFLHDTFTDTDAVNLNAHTGETGATWIKNTTASAGNWLVKTNRIYTTGSAPMLYYASGIPSDPDYTVVAVVHITSQVASSWGVGARYSTTANTGYACRMLYGTAGNGTLVLISFLAGAVDATTSSGSFPFTVGNDYIITLTTLGTGISCSATDGANASGTISITNSTTTGAGRVVVYGNGAVTTTTGIHIDEITGTN